MEGRGRGRAAGGVCPDDRGIFTPEGKGGTGR